MKCNFLSFPRRILGLPKTMTSKQLTQKCLSSATSFSSESEVHEEETIPKPQVPKETKPAPLKTSLLDIKKISRRRCKMPKAVRKKFYVTTNEAYYLADNQTSPSPLVCSETLIDGKLSTNAFILMNVFTNNSGRKNNVCTCMD